MNDMDCIGQSMELNRDNPIGYGITDTSTSCYTVRNGLCYYTNTKIRNEYVPRRGVYKDRSPSWSSASEFQTRNTKTLFCDVSVYLLWLIRTMSVVGFMPARYPSVTFAMCKNSEVGLALVLDLSERLIPLR